jgi:hypothetical protein
MPGAMEIKIGQPMRVCDPLLMQLRGVKKMTSALTDWFRVKNRSAKGLGKKRTEPLVLCPLSSASHDAVILVGKSSQTLVVGSPPEKMHAHQRSLSYLY